MILADANILLYAYDKNSRFHVAASEWLETCLSDAAPFCLAWQTITAFVRIATNLKVFAQPLSGAGASKVVTEWLARHNVVILTPGPRHWSIFSDLIIKGRAYGPLVMDAHLAALAIEHGAVLYTTDRDFSRFPGIRFVNPLLSLSAE